MAVVKADFVLKNLARLRVFDASFFMDAEARARHRVQVEGARRFDIDVVADRDSSLPHMLPSAERFGSLMTEAGVTNTDHVLLYDHSDGQMVASARAYLMFVMFGHDPERVKILQGGFKGWPAGMAASASGSAGRYEARFDASRVATLRQMRDIVSAGNAQIVDSRAASRFTGAVDEPRPGLARGAMPGAVNVPFNEVMCLGSLGYYELRPADELRLLFAERGVDLSRPVVTTCGSGVTAAVDSVALLSIGVDSVLYDGSWSEWGALTDTPKVVLAPQ